jgi:hypothetical protein
MYPLALKLGLDDRISQKIATKQRNLKTIHEMKGNSLSFCEGKQGNTCKLSSARCVCTWVSRSTTTTTPLTYSFQL